MASFSSSYSEDLTCSICLTIFSDPVTLHCGHSFCRECIRLSLRSQQQCPQCRTAVPTDRTDLTTNHILKSLAEKINKAAELKREPGPDKEMAELCPEHEEKLKLKLFCVTDQQLACIICRDGEKHEGHKFKPVKEAAASLRKELETFVQRVADDISAVERLAITQKQEIIKTKDKSQQLTTQISSQFEEMHQFLRKREDEIKKELKHKEEEEMKKMRKNLKALEAVLSENKALDKKVKSLLETSDPELFLKNWTEESSVKSAKSSFQPRGSDLKVLNMSLCLGPYESHLQFFVWKEIQHMIQPREERLTVANQNSTSNVFADGRSLLPARQQYQPEQHYYFCGSHESMPNYYEEDTMMLSNMSGAQSAYLNINKNEDYTPIVTIPIVAMAAPRLAAAVPVNPVILQSSSVCRPSSVAPIIQHKDACKVYNHQVLINLRKYSGFGSVSSKTYSTLLSLGLLSQSYRTGYEATQPPTSTGYTQRHQKWNERKQ